MVDSAVRCEMAASGGRTARAATHASRTVSGRARDTDAPPVTETPSSLIWLGLRPALRAADQV
jgi:hypothetical protein